MRSLKELAKTTECIGSEGGSLKICTVVLYCVYRSVVEGFSGELAFVYTSALVISGVKGRLKSLRCVGET